jgi:hypothetical protein
MVALSLGHCTVTSHIDFDWMEIHRGTPLREGNGFFLSFLAKKRRVRAGLVAHVRESGGSMSGSRAAAVTD